MKNRGRIVSLFAGIGKVEGLKGVSLGEVLKDDKGQLVGLVFGFEKERVEVLFFSEKLRGDRPVFPGKKTFFLKISPGIIGRIIDGLGKERDGLGPLKGEEFPVFAPAPPIIEREPVSVPLSTGVKLIDATLPLGRGQRELILGDRKLGKTTLAVDIVLNQKRAKPPVYCIYVICGQKEKQAREIIEIFEKNNAFTYTTVVLAPAGSSFASQFLAPFLGCTIGEYFRDRGKDALVVYDDLSKHAKVYRDISLILKRAPGREAYPGDIFSLHAKLLERAGKLKKGGSLTALPIIETQEGDIASFIPTNLISITDGQIYLERRLFQKGFLPPINIGLSVSRIGGKAQPKPLKEVTGGIRLTLAQHRELQKLSQLETVLSQEARRRIFRGELILQLLKQRKHTNVLWPEQTILFYAVESGFFDDIEKEQWSKFESLLLELIRTRYVSLLEKIEKETLTEEIKKQIFQAISDFKQEFVS